MTKAANTQPANILSTTRDRCPDPVPGKMSSDQNPSSSTTTTRMVVDRFNKAFNSHDADALASWLTDDTVFENTSPPPNGLRIEGREAVVQFWRDWFSRNTDSTFEAEDTIVCGDRAV